jgi:hypothetical protein
MTGGPGEKPIRLPVFIQQLEKVTEEAYAEGREPALALRYFAPQSILSSPEGWIDVVVRPVAYDGA